VKCTKEQPICSSCVKIGEKCSYGPAEQHAEAGQKRSLGPDVEHVASNGPEPNVSANSSMGRMWEMGYGPGGGGPGQASAACHLDPSHPLTGIRSQNPKRPNNGGRFFAASSSNTRHVESTFWAYIKGYSVARPFEGSSRALLTTV
jgi:hypothetical protein